MLPKISPLKDASASVEFIGNRSPINFHAGRENNEIEPLADGGEEKFNMRPQMDEKVDRLIIDDYLVILLDYFCINLFKKNPEDEIWRCSRFDCLSEQAIMM